MIIFASDFENFSFGVNSFLVCKRIKILKVSKHKGMQKGRLKSRVFASAVFVILITAFICVYMTLSPFQAFASEKNVNADIVALENELEDPVPPENVAEEKKNFIRWIDLNADGKTLKAVLKLCKDYREKGAGPDFCEVLAYLATKNGNNFSAQEGMAATLKKLRAHLDTGGAVADVYKENKYYKYYVESYHAIFDGLIGNFHRGDSENIEYGVKGFFPLAGGFWHNHYDDFGSKRTYGYKRRHLGHDMMGAVGTPIIACEGGTVTELGWNRYGGWRVGIRSHDQKRYYYYAHLRKDKPYPSALKPGDTVKTGQVVGFLGHTGYSVKENVNLKTGEPHLHLGLQIIFDPSQEKGAKEIWVDLYGITNFLASDRAKVVKNPDTQEWNSESIKYPV